MLTKALSVPMSTVASIIAKWNKSESTRTLPALSRPAKRRNQAAATGRPVRMERPEVTVELPRHQDGACVDVLVLTRESTDYITIFSSNIFESWGHVGDTHGLMTRFTPEPQLPLQIQMCKTNQSFTILCE